jgi:hypothetical protein
LYVVDCDVASVPIIADLTVERYRGELVLNGGQAAAQASAQVLTFF